MHAKEDITGIYTGCLHGPESVQGLEGVCLASRRSGFDLPPASAQPSITPEQEPGTALCDASTPPPSKEKTDCASCY